MSTSRSRFASRGAALVLASLATVWTPAPARAQHGRGAAAESLGPLGEMSWRFVGPYGNRAAAAAGVAGNPAIMYVGAASGGIWKTENGGVNWQPVFDHEDVSAVGALAVSQSNPNVVWAGTGETWLIRPYYPMGDGVYKSTDGGAHWQHMGLDATGHIGRIVIDPHDPQRVFVCALGQLFKAQPERGVYRTLDGGKTWKLVLGPNADTGCNDLAMDPADPNTLLAGMWQVRVYPWNLDSGGPDGGLYVSRDGGDTWTQLSGHGLPRAPHVVGKVAVAIAQSLPTRWYALVQDSQPTLYRSNDAGVSWTMVSHDHMMLQRDSYYVNFGVSTTDPDRLYFVSPNYTISLDGGKTFLRPGGENGFGSAGGDNHDIWVDPENSNRILVANDAGLSVSLDGSRSFEHIRLPIAQVYHVTTDDKIPYDIYGNLQDASSFMGPSNTLSGRGFFGGGIQAGDFRSVGGCESGTATPDPTDADVIWSGCYEGVITRMNLKDGQVRDVSPWPDVADGWAPRDVKYRWDWTIPLAISPFDHNRVYVGSQYVHETTDGGQSWKTISPDLTLDDPAHEGNSGGITHDNLYTYDAALIFSIAESPAKRGVIWAGTNDGQVSLTRDGGAHWTNVTKNISGLAPMGTIWNIEPSPFDAGTAYITVNREQMGDYDAYAYKTADYGRSWTMISAGIPKGYNSSAHCIIEDPVRQGMLYLGTDNAIYVSWNDGGSWTKLNQNLPPAPVYWITVQPRFNDLVVATYGRGDWIMDDITALRQYDPGATAAALYPLRAAYRFRQKGDGRLSEPGARVVGQNPPYGADINFYLPEAGPATITVAGADGKTVNTLHVRGIKGLNRVWWDLRYPNGSMPHMLVPPPDAPWVPNGPAGYHILTGIMIPGTVTGPRVTPGSYTVKLDAGGAIESQTLHVLADPASLGTAATMQAQLEFKQGLEREIDTVSNMIEHLEWVRKQLADVEMRYRGDASHRDVVAESRRLADQAIAVEGKLIDVHLTDGNEDLNRFPSQLYQKLTALYDKDESDLGPTAGDVAVNDYFKTWMASSRASLDAFTSKTVPAFNARLKSEGVEVEIQP